VVVVVYLIWPKDVVDAISEANVAYQLKNGEDNKPIPAETPLIDFDTLASDETLPEAPTLQSSQNNDAENDQNQPSLDHDEDIGVFINNLEVSVQTSSKAVINGEVYQFGDYIDATNTVKLFGIREGILYFEVKNRLYPYLTQH
jgi:hypothetical protein